MAKILIGTSGFTYQHWRGIFYPSDLPQSKWLEFYARQFQAVEINASFYHQMSRKIYEGWTKRTPDNFIFTIKGSRFITHIKRLKDCREPVKRFLESVGGLGEKLGVILWQLPPRWGVDTVRLREFLELLEVDFVFDARGPVGLHPHPTSSPGVHRDAGARWGSPAPATPRLLNSYHPPRASPAHKPYTLHPKPYFRHAFEFRDKSWLNEKVYTILREHNAALVIQDSPNWPTEEVIAADFTYLRFHGRDSLYGSCYNEEELKEWAKKIKRWVKGGIGVYAFFNNDAHGYAVRNARGLRELVSSEL